MFSSLFQFYRSKEWENFRKVILLERLEKDGELICEHCGKPITRAYDAICHHKTHLTESNLNDFDISLNENNIAVVHHACHNQIHQRFGAYTRHIYIVYGAPCSGKSTFVKESATKDDLIVDIDKIYSAISINPQHIKSNRLKSNAFQLRDILLDMVKTRNGKWVNAWIIAGMPLKMDRERLADTLGAELIFIEAPKELCLERAYKRGGETYQQYVEDWYEKYQS